MQPQAVPWFENEDFWTAAYPFMFPETSFDRAKAEIPKMVTLMGATKIRSVLDLCCGPGRHSIPLAKDGFDVTAVDRSAFLLSKAKAYAERENVSITWIQDDMRHFVQP